MISLTYFGHLTLASYFGIGGGSHGDRTKYTYKDQTYIKSMAGSFK